MTTPKIIGCLIEATAPRRPKRRGVVLPPAPRSRNGVLRLAIDGKKPIPFKPDEWTITVKAGPAYAYGNLPAEHLATRTMLKTEQRKQPTAAQRPVATYAVRKGYALLYAVADTVPMPALPSARAEAWTKARTCIYCGKAAPRPFEASPEGDRYCLKCHEEIAFVRWSLQALDAQADAAAWARELIAGNRVVLLVVDQHPPNCGGVWWQLRAETPAGEILADARIRYSDEAENDFNRHPDFWTPERIAEHAARREGTVGPTEFRPTIETLAGCRVIMWRSHFGRGPFPANVESVVPAGDQICERFALWSGWTWGRSGYWFPTPAIPWGQSSIHPAYKAFEALLRSPRDLAAEIAALRDLLFEMADEKAPEPSIGHPKPDSP